MDLKLQIQLIILWVLNIIFFFSGVVLNTLVIITILKSTQLGKKLCHFMIMVLSCSDLLSVIGLSLVMNLDLIAGSTEDNDLFANVGIYRVLSILSGACPLFVYPHGNVY